MTTNRGSLKRLWAILMAFFMVFQTLPVTTLAEALTDAEIPREVSVVESAVPAEEPAVPAEEAVAPAEEPAEGEENPEQDGGTIVSESVTGAKYATVLYETQVNGDIAPLSAALASVGEPLGTLPEAPAFEGCSFLGWFVEVPQEAVAPAEGEEAPAEAATVRVKATEDMIVTGDMVVIASYYNNAYPALKAEYKDDLISVVINVPEGALPADIMPRLRTISADTVREQVEGVVSGDVNEISAVEISFMKMPERVKVQPLRPVTVEVTRTGMPAGNVAVVHIPDEGEAELVAKGIKESEFSFEADSFSIYAVAGYIVQDYLSDNGTLYEVGVTYGEDAQIPEGASLEISEFAEGSAEYEEALKAWIADCEKRGIVTDPLTTGFAALDISIMYEGQKIEPAAPVQVNFRIKALPYGEDLSEVTNLEIQHHVKVPGGVSVETVYTGNVTPATRSATGSIEFQQDTDDVAAAKGTFVDPSSVELKSGEEEIAVEFETPAFSTYTLYYNYNYYSKRIHYVDTNGNSLTPTTTPSFNTSRNMYLIYDIEGYKYVRTSLGRLNGTTIPPQLHANSDYGAYYSNSIQYVNGDSWSGLGNTNDIYVVYEPKPEATQGGTPKTDPSDETWPAGTDAPQFNKASKNNGDGTNTIRLDIKAAEKHIENKTKANVIVVFDVSGSMNWEMNGTEHEKWNGKRADRIDSRARLSIARTAVNAMADTLLNLKDSNNKKLVKMSLITFSTKVNENAQGWTDDPTTFKNAVNALTASGGTNWQGALEAANQKAVADDDAATFIVFVTDGEPTFRYARGNYTDSQLETDGMYNFASQYRSDYVFGPGGDSSQYCRDTAKTEVQSIQSHNKTLHTVGVSNDVRNLRAIGGTYHDGSNAAALARAFEEITEAISSDLGFGNVKITDGITSLTSSDIKVLSSVDVNSFKYYRIVNGTRTEWSTDAMEEAGCGEAHYNEDTGAVEWNMGADFQLEDGVTYQVEFIVWPSQAAYDLVADLNNGLKKYDDLPQAQKDQIAELNTNPVTYTLKTNTDTVNATYNKTTKTGDTVTIAETTPVTITDPEPELEDMNLSDEKMKVQKIWNNKLDAREQVKPIYLRIFKDGVEYLSDVEVAPPTWTRDDIHISTGYITKTGTTYVVHETGHDYQVYEPENFAYYWDLRADVYRPMVINTTTHMLVKDDNRSGGTNGSDYYVIEGHKYWVDNSVSTLIGTNDRRSWLQLEKHVTGTGAPANALFDFTVTVTTATGEKVWFSADQDPNPSAEQYVKDLDTNATPEVDDEGNRTGYYYIASGSQITMKIKAGWTIRFTNLPTGSHYQIAETTNTLPDGFIFVNATSRVVDDAVDRVGDDPEPASVDNQNAQGTINATNAEYYVDYNNKYESVDVTVTKSWDDQSNKFGLRPDDLTLTLLRGREGSEEVEEIDTTVATKWVKNENNTWTYKWTGLPKTNANGTNYIYTIAEKEANVPAGYTVSGTPAQNGGTITNSLNVGSLKVTKTVSIEPASAAEGKAYTFTVQTTINGATKYLSLTNGAVTLSNTAVENTITWPADGTTPEVVFPDLPVGSYIVTEQGTGENGAAQITNYTLNGTFTGTGEVTASETPATVGLVNNYTRKEGSLTVSKTVEDNTSAADPNKTFAFTVKLSENVLAGYATDPKTITVSDPTGPDEDGKYTITFNLKNGESVTLSGLPVGATYTTAETADPDFTKSVTGAESGSITTDGTTVAYKNTRKAGTLTITKKVVDETGADLASTEDYAITVKKDGEVYQQLTFTGAGSRTLTNVPRGNYIVEETQPAQDGIEGYIFNGIDYSTSVTIQNAEDSGELTVTNKYIKLIDVTVTKSWDDQSNKFGLRPDDLTLTLQRVREGSEEVEEIGTTVATSWVKNENNTWTYTWTNLPKTDADGNTYTYTIAEKEADVPAGYTVSGTPAQNGGTITNSLNVGSLKVTKTVSIEPATAAANKAYTFTVQTTINGATKYLSLTNGAVTLSNTAVENTITWPADGTTPEVVFPDLPVGSYIVTEQGTGENGAAQITNYTLNGTFTGTGEVTASETPATVGLVNNYTRKVVDVQLKKNVKGNMGDVNKKFSFTVVIMDANGSPLANFNNETITTDANGKVTKPISLKHGEIFDFGNLPVGAKVTITEENPDYPDLPAETINSQKTTITRDDTPDQQLVSMDYTFVVPNQTCTVIYTNEREIKVDTGVANDMMPYVLLLGFVTLAGAGLLMGRRRRRAI